MQVEFTQLGSFGNIDTFAGNLINSLDRSYLLRQNKPPKEPIQVGGAKGAFKWGKGRLHEGNV